MAEEDNDLAQDRTDLAEDRTLLAHERSFAGWVRTGMAAVGIGLALHALFGKLQPIWVAKGVASGFFLTAVFVFVSAERRACAMLSRLDAHNVTALRPIRLRLLTGALSVLTILLAVGVWLLVD